jgi:hypothetical protein
MLISIPLMSYPNGNLQPSPYGCPEFKFIIWKEKTFKCQGKEKKKKIKKTGEEELEDVDHHLFNKLYFSC